MNVIRWKECETLPAMQVAFSYKHWIRRHKRWAVRHIPHTRVVTKGVMTSCRWQLQEISIICNFTSRCVLFFKFWWWKIALFQVLHLSHNMHFTSLSWMSFTSMCKWTVMSKSNKYLQRTIFSYKRNKFSERDFKDAEYNFRNICRYIILNCLYSVECSYLTRVWLKK